MRNSNLQTTGNILVKKNGAKYFHNGQKWASMFSKCFHRHFEHQKSRLFKRLFDILYTIQTRLYYFLNGLKFALFGHIHRYNSIKTGLFPMRLRKMFSKMFSRSWFWCDYCMSWKSIYFSVRSSIYFIEWLYYYNWIK